MLLPETPFASPAADQPLFKLESRRIKWGTDRRTLIRSSRSRILIIVGVCLLIWGLVVMNGLGAGNTATLIRNNESLVNLLAIFSLIGFVYVDFVSLAAAIEGIKGEVISGRWDLLRLANMSEEQFVMQKHALAQLRTWLPVVNVVSIRVALVMCAILGILFSSYTLTRLIWGIPAVLLASWIAICEPMWRMRAMTAVGLWVSASTRNSISSLSLAVAMTFGLWLLQIIFTSTVLIIIFLFTIRFLVFAASADFFEALIQMVLIFPLGLSIYGFYALLQQWCMRRIISRLARMEM